MPSDKIKSKDLSYETSLPPFLQRLHDQKAGRGDTDRHEFQVARPKRDKNPDEDDGPTVVDETGENVSKDELAKLTAPDEEDGNVTGELQATDPKASGALPAGGESARKGKETVTDGTTSKKRKAGKVVGDDAVEDEPSEATATSGKAVKKPKKKAKVKLTFDESEGDGT